MWLTDTGSFSSELKNKSKNYMTLETSPQGKKIVKQNSDVCVLICVQWLIGCF